MGNRLMAVRFSETNLRRLAVASLLLAGVIFLVLIWAYFSGNFDQNVRSLIPTFVIALAIAGSMKAVLKKRAAEEYLGGVE